MNEMIFNKMRTQGELILDEAMLEMPIKKSKQLQNMIKLKVEQKKLIDQVHSRFRDLKGDSQVLPVPKQLNSNTITNNLTNKPVKAITAVQKELKMTHSNSQYLVNCVIRALRYRKLAIDDIADIFGIYSETVEQIDKFRRIKQLQVDNFIGNGVSNYDHNDKLKKMKMMKFKNYNLGVDGFSAQGYNYYGGNNNRTLASSSHSRKSHPAVQLYNNPAHNTLSSYQLSSIMESAQQRRQPQDDNLLEYQKLLRCKPPHRLDDKVRAIIEIIKKHPNIMQKEIITILAKDYNITNMTQTSISRYYKKIYQMRKHCQVLLQAKKDGFIDI